MAKLLSGFECEVAYYDVTACPPGMKRRWGSHICKDALVERSTLLQSMPAHRTDCVLDQ